MIDTSGQMSYDHWILLFVFFFLAHLKLFCLFILTIISFSLFKYLHHHFKNVSVSFSSDYAIVFLVTIFNPYYHLLKNSVLFHSDDTRHFDCFTKLQINIINLFFNMFIFASPSSFEATNYISNLTSSS